MRNKRNRGFLYIALALLLGAYTETSRSRPFDVASLLGAAGAWLLIFAIVGELGFWIWTKVSN